MAHKQLLHELLKEDQEPFHLKSYISERKSLLKNKASPTTTLQLTKRKPIAAKRSNILSRHACFLSFHNSPDVGKSPFRDLPSPVKSPCKSPNNAVLLHIPSRTAALLVEAAMRIQKQHKSQSKNVGFGLFGSFVKSLKERSKIKKRAIESSDFKVEETVGVSCSCGNRRLSSTDWTENNEDKSMDFEESSSDCGSECLGDENFAVNETSFRSRTFRFSLHRSPSSSGRCTPELYSPAASPSHHDEKKYESRKSDDQGREEEEEKEQCSPVSVLDPPFNEDVGSGDVEEDDYDTKRSYENVQRAKQQLLHRLRRFEKLAELDPIELERKLLEESDEQDNDPLSLYRKHSTVESFVSQVFDQPSLSRNMPTDHTKKLVSDLIVEEKSETINPGTNDVIMERLCNRFDPWKEVEFDTIDMMVALDLKRGSDGWTRFDEQVEETAEEIERAVYALLVEEFSDELFCYKCDDLRS